MKRNGRIILFTITLIAIATACKFFFGPDITWSGFSPVIAIALFSGFIIKQKDTSFLLPLLALLASDAIIQLLYSSGQFDYPGFYTGQWKNYAVLLLSTLLGWGLKGKNLFAIFGGALAAAVLYFLVSNFMVWNNSGEAFYPRTFSGLMLCYEAAVPFFKNSLVATILFVPVIALIWNLFMERKAAISIA